MNFLPYRIHEFITSTRRLATSTPDSDQEVSKVTTPSDSEQKSAFVKEYPRMPKVELPDPLHSEVSLQESFLLRDSQRTTSAKELSLTSLSTILHSMSFNGRGTKTYPSGGALYPIEVYVLARRVENLTSGVYHYHSPSHQLEHLWELPSPLGIFSRINSWAEDARVLLFFTGCWYRNIPKYDNFAYLLGLLETGHAAQNALLIAGALKINACPLAGFDDEVVTKILDLDPNGEQPVYCIALG